MTEKQKTALRRAVAMHMDNEGCGCCEDHKGHKESAIALAELLGMDLHDDKSGVNYAKYLDRHAKEV